MNLASQDYRGINVFSLVAMNLASQDYRGINVFSLVAMNLANQDLGVFQKYELAAPQSLLHQGSLFCRWFSGDLVFHTSLKAYAWPMGPYNSYLIFNVAIANATHRIVTIQNRVTILLS